MPYHVLSVKEKLEIIRTIENGAKKSAVAREKNLPLTTVCGIWNAREKLRGGSGSNLKRCRIRDSAFPEVEKALLLWLKKARSMNLPVSGPLLAEKALTFAAQLNCTGFACSNGWLSRFKARYSIVGKAVCGGDDADGEDAEDCENLLVEVLERQGAADEEVNFGTFGDVDGDVTTSPDFSDSDMLLPSHLVQLQAKVGTVMDSPADFYHARVPKKDRKLTMVEELLADAEFRRFNKKKYGEAMARQQRSVSKKALKHMKRLKKRKK
ncbi:hypothetical protein HPB49_011011 [Dermacentor silvarum]|uniref:Uncharacterized protein n=1 Tax=Dermacentor silvarum TaxID=543639 RepID=A0ACB8E0C3_DERSI|nr:hypothetical protein HPB49_011011 [Dermacentor silvarum]